MNANIYPINPKTPAEAEKALRSFIAGYAEGVLIILLPKKYKKFQNQLILNFLEGYSEEKFGPEEYSRREEKIIKEAIHKLFN